MTGRRPLGSGVKHWAHNDTADLGDLTGEPYIRARWPHWCVEQGLHLGRKGEEIVPELIDYTTTGDIERYTVRLPGIMARDSVNLTEILVASNEAQTGYTHELRPGVYEHVLNYHQLPRYLPLNPDKLVTNPNDHRVYFGELASGPDLYWDLTEDGNAHGLFCGDNGSGKTKAAALAITQFLLQGAEVTIITPTFNDHNLQLFADHGATVICGADPDSIAHQAKAVHAWFDEMIDREKQMTGEWYQGRRSVLVFDEFGHVTNHKKRDDKETRLHRDVICELAQEGSQRSRKTLGTMLFITQEPAVAHLGGDSTILEQTGFRLGVTKMARRFQATLFPKVDDRANPAIARVLSNPSTPKGRGIARGAAPAGDGVVAVTDETPVQVAHAETSDYQQILNGGPVETVTPDDILPPNPNPEQDPGPADDGLIRMADLPAVFTPTWDDRDMPPLKPQPPTRLPFRFDNINGPTAVTIMVAIVVLTAAAYIAALTAGAS